VVQNFGAAMVESVLRATDPNIPYRGVTASRGKVQRAEPIAAITSRDAFITSASSVSW
jgi:phage terminase large subunit-like protein